MSILGIKMQQVASLYKTNNQISANVNKKSTIPKLQKDEFIPSGQANNVAPLDYLNNPVRMAKIDKIAENISSGTYQINYGAVAGILLDASEA